MYVRPISIRLLTGRSTPTTRAISVLSPSQNQFAILIFDFRLEDEARAALQSEIKNRKSKIYNSPLALLVLGVRADHAHHPFAVDDLAVVAHLLDRSPDLHRFLTPFRESFCAA